MAITVQDVVGFIVDNGVNGNLPIDLTGNEQVLESYEVEIDEHGVERENLEKPIYKTHTFKYSLLHVRREDITELV